MSLFDRLRRRVRDFFRPPPPPPPPAPPPPPPPPTPPPAPPGEPPDREPERTAFGDPDVAPPVQDLPPGWRFEGLYHPERDPSDRRVINKDPSDYDVANAGAVIVSYTDGLGTTYRTVHGPLTGRAQVGKIILRTTIPNSPPR